MGRKHVYRFQFRALFDFIENGLHIDTEYIQQVADAPMTPNPSQFQGVERQHKLANVESGTLSLYIYIPYTSKPWKFVGFVSKPRF